MPRTIRPYLPGTPFHLIAQVAFREKMMGTDVIRTSVLDYLADALHKCDAVLLAYCLLANHIHLVVVQGRAPLSRLMATFVGRTALCIQRHHEIRGRIFDGPFESFVCDSASYLREAIVYTHLNPCRAKIVRSPGAYRWSSHNEYLGVAEPTPLSPLLLREYGVFQEKVEGLPGPESYMKYVDYRLRVDRAKRQTVPSQVSHPILVAGDEAWMRRYVQRAGKSTWGRPKRLDLRDIALQIVSVRMPGCPLHVIQGRNRSRIISETRREVIVAAHAAGHRCVDIARFLNITESRVSAITINLGGPYPVRRSMEVRVGGMSG